MKKPAILLSLFIILVFLIISPFFAIGKNSGPTGNKIDAKFLKEINKNVNSVHTVIVFMKNNGPVKQYSAKGKALKKVAFNDLRSKAATSQKNLLKTLKSEKTSGRLIKYEPNWLANAVIVKAKGDVIKKIASRNDIETVIKDFEIPKPSLPRPTGKATQAVNDTEWNITKIGADQAWGDYSVDGTGVRVGIIDTGIDGSHPDLTGKVDLFAVIKDDNVVTTSNVVDPYGHGTHVAGIIAGGDAGGTKIGVAPGVKLLGVGFGFDDWYLSYFIKSVQWIIDPDSNIATDDGADVLNVSLGYGEQLPQLFRPMDNLIAAGVLPCVSIGNSGEDTAFSPGDIPSSFGVGATDKNDRVTDWSSGGIAEFNDFPYYGKWMKPDISAPGDNIRSSVSGEFKDWMGDGSQWMELSGTSMAAPHVAGAAALLKQENPALTVDQIRQLLEISAIDMGKQGKDTRYGNGRLDIKKALDYAQTAGTLQGKVDNLGQGIEADIRIVELNGIIHTDPFGNYKSMVPSGSYTLQAYSYGFLPNIIPGVTVTQGGTTIQDISLVESPQYDLSGLITDKDTGQPISEANVVVKDRDIQTTSNALGEYAVKLPNGVYTLDITAQGYEDNSTDVTVAANTEANIEMTPLPPILLIGDFWDEDFVSYYKDALDSLGLKYTYRTIYDFDNGEYFDPDADYLKQYAAVIWASDFYPSFLEDYSQKITLDHEDYYPPTQDAMSNYLDSGGRLFVSGQDLAYVLSRSRDYEEEEEMNHSRNTRSMPPGGYGNFLDNYLHAEYVKDKPKNLEVSGVTGSPMDGVDFRLYNYADGEDGANNQYYPDVIKPADKYAKKIFNYTKEMSGSAALSIDTGDYKIIYTAFGIESINTAAKREEVMEKSLDWLQSDTFGPYLFLLNKSKTFFSGRANFFALAFDNGGINKVQFWLNGALKKTAYNFPYEHTINTKNYHNGRHRIKIVAFDESGNTTTFRKEIWFDNISPEVEITQPASSQEIKGISKFKAKASDNQGIKKVSFYLNDSKIATDDSAPYEMKLNSTKYVNGKYNLKVIAKDKAGNTAKDNLDIEINNGVSVYMTVNPATITPDDDGYKETAKLTYDISQPGRVYLVINDLDGQIVNLLNGVYKASGRYSSSWNGRSSDGKKVKNGKYRAKVILLNEGKYYSASKIVEVNVPPVQLSGVWASPNPFTPNGDSFQDKTGIAFTLNHDANATVQIFDGDGLVTTVLNNMPRKRGVNGIAWDGKGNDGKVLPAGNYKCTVSAKDINGTSASKSFVLTLK